MISDHMICIPNPWKTAVQNALSVAEALEWMISHVERDLEGEVELELLDLDRDLDLRG